VRRRVLYKICKKCISRARAPHGRDAWGVLYNLKNGLRHTIKINELYVLTTPLNFDFQKYFVIDVLLTGISHFRRIYS
jgi:hypothetical protein